MRTLLTSPSRTAVSMKEVRLQDWHGAIVKKYIYSRRFGNNIICYFRIWAYKPEANLSSESLASVMVSTGGCSRLTSAVSIVFLERIYHWNEFHLKLILGRVVITSDLIIILHVSYNNLIHIIQTFRFLFRFAFIKLSEFFLLFTRILEYFFQNVSYRCYIM